MQNVAYVVYIDKYTVIRGVRVNGLRPNKIMVYVHSNELGSKEFNAFLAEAGITLSATSTCDDVLVQVVHTANVDRLMERVDYIKEFTEVHYQRLLVHEKNKVERLEKILSLNLWNYIKYKIFKS